MSVVMMKKSDCAVPGAAAAMAIVPAMLPRPVWSVGLERDRRIELAGVAGDPALDQPAVARERHGAVEGLAVEAVRIDIVEEVGGGDRRMAPVERDDDAAERWCRARPEQGRRSAARGGGRGLGERAGRRRPRASAARNSVIMAQP